MSYLGEIRVCIMRIIGEIYHDASKVPLLIEELEMAGMDMGNLKKMSIEAIGGFVYGLKKKDARRLLVMLSQSKYSDTKDQMTRRLEEINKVLKD